MDMQVSLTAAESQRVRELLKGATEIKAGYEGLTEAEAIDLLMVLDGVDEVEARFRVAIERSETAGCCEDLPAELVTRAA